MKKHTMWWLGPVLLVCGVWSARAQEAPKAAALEEIVVTARKRTEDLQSVPVAVSAFQGKFLEEQFTSTVSDLERFTPNVQLQPIEYSGGGLTAAIRGVGFGDLEKSFEPAVAVSVDGLFLASNTGATIDSFDIASVEILRGPQGTLFGRNTVGGTVNITRTRPTGEWGLKAAVSYGSYDSKTFKMIANAPLIKDVLALKVGAYVSNWRFVHAKHRIRRPRQRRLKSVLHQRATVHAVEQFRSVAVLRSYQRQIAVPQGRQPDDARRAHLRHPSWRRRLHRRVLRCGEGPGFQSVIHSETLLRAAAEQLDQSAHDLARTLVRHRVDDRVHRHA